MTQSRRAPRILLVLLGGWICLILGMTYVATSNFKVVEPSALRDADRIYADIPEGPPRRQALRYVAGELNRHFFEAYDQAQILVGVAALVALALSGRRRRLLPVMLLALCLLFTTVSWGWLTPTVTEIGRQIDFMPREPEPPEVARFRFLHFVSVTFELSKLVMLAVLVVLAVRDRGPAVFGSERPEAVSP